MAKEVPNLRKVELPVFSSFSKL